MRYYSAKGMIMIVLISLLLVMTIVTLWYGVYIVSLITIFITGYFVWMWFDSYYTVDGDKLLYRSALLNGSVSIDTIFEIVKSSYQYSGIKASLATKGLVIKYNRWDDIYISPKDADQFITRLKDINPNINIVG